MHARDIMNTRIKAEHMSDALMAHLAQPRMAIAARHHMMLGHHNFQSRLSEQGGSGEATKARANHRHINA